MFYVNMNKVNIWSLNDVKIDIIWPTIYKNLTSLHTHEKQDWQMLMISPINSSNHLQYQFTMHNNIMLEADPKYQYAKFVSFPSSVS